MRKKRERKNVRDGDEDEKEIRTERKIREEE